MQKNKVWQKRRVKSRNEALLYPSPCSRQRASGKGELRRAGGVEGGRGEKSRRGGTEETGGRELVTPSSEGGDTI